MRRHFKTIMPIAATLLGLAGCAGADGVQIHQARLVTGTPVAGQPWGGPTSLTGTPLDGPPAGMPSALPVLSDIHDKPVTVVVRLVPVTIVKGREQATGAKPIVLTTIVGRAGQAGASTERNGVWYGLEARQGTASAERDGTTKMDRLVHYTVYRSGKPGPVRVDGAVRFTGTDSGGSVRLNRIYSLNGADYDATVTVEALSPPPQVRTRSGGTMTMPSFPDERNQ